ncbi:MAG: hypothetical protein K8H99_06650 [Nitrospirae bacterium]|nr:hypothetical protein [Fimbriimonadaceae bacterium]
MGFKDVQVIVQYKHASWNSVVGAFFGGAFAVALYVVAAWTISTDGHFSNGLPLIIFATVLAFGAIVEVGNVRNRTITVYDSGEIVIVDWARRQFRYKLEDIVAIRKLSWLKHAGDEPLVIVEFSDGK